VRVFGLASAMRRFRNGIRLRRRPSAICLPEGQEARPQPSTAGADERCNVGDTQATIFRRLRISALQIRRGRKRLARGRA
jgi:hypothetical protein